MKLEFFKIEVECCVINSSVTSIGLLLRRTLRRSEHYSTIIKNLSYRSVFKTLPLGEVEGLIFYAVTYTWFRVNYLDAACVPCCVFHS